MKNKEETLSKLQTNGVQTLLGEPKKAIIKLALPMIAAMLIQTIYNLADALWVSGLGADALAAVGFVFPLFILIMAIATGIGMGSGSAISRRIGSNDKTGADNVAAHSLVIIILLSLVFTLPLIVFSESIFLFIGAGDTITLTESYANVIFGGIIFIFFANIVNAILRGEGDAKRAMYAMALGSGLNIVLDPIFIYTLGLGVAGAAWATVLSLAVTSVFLSYLLFFKKDTFVSIRFRGFHFKKPILIDIFRVGLPASFSQISMSVVMIIINFIIVLISAGNTDGVAVYTIGWRIATIAVLPLMGIATAVLSVSGAAYGARAYEKINISHLYGIKVGLIIEVIISLVTFIFAPQIAAAFTQSQGAKHLAGDITVFLRIISLFYPFIAFGMLSGAVFQGIGKGLYAFLGTALRTLILTIFFAMIFAFIFQWGLTGIWWSIDISNFIGSIVIFVWVRYYIKKLMKTKSERSKSALV